VHGSRYGTLRSEIGNALARGRIVVLDIDFQGARQIRAAFSEAVLIFILPPSTEELIRRLLGRATETDEQRRSRLKTARVELGVIHEFDYVVVNDDFDRAIHALESILEAERHRITRTPGIPERLRELNESLNDVLKGATT
jgi:guanylate kinase